MYNQEKDTSKEVNPTPSLVVEKQLQSRSIIISGEINQALAEKVISQLLILQEMGN
ncbi:MAG: ATP-dependent Clp protease proteolytic subunit [Clostridium sp.]|uniref:ATP-dependent Clp protease proteolytic subunit n=1 Tax=Clostridium sp. TaxID=1506 RepID=UPI003F365DEC